MEFCQTRPSKRLAQGSSNSILISLDLHTKVLNTKVLHTTHTTTLLSKVLRTSLEVKGVNMEFCQTRLPQKTCIQKY